MRRQRRLIVAGLTALLLAGATAAGVHGRRSLHAAYRALLDPSLIDEPPALAPASAGCGVLDGPEGELDARIAREFRELDHLALDDPDTALLAGLTTTDLPVAITRRTLRFVKFFGTDPVGRKAFSSRFRRSGRYRQDIEQQLREAGLPEDLVWVAAIESAFDPQSVSPAGAAGLWQFMPGTGQLYGLEISPWLDERRSLTRATEAAVIHLRDLFERLGSWDLALAAYNYGYDGVLRALGTFVERRSEPNEADGAVHYTDLAQARLLPLETADYVPKVTAFAIVAANMARFDLDQVVPDEPVRLATLAVPEATPLRTVARAAGLSTATLQELNPQLLRRRVPPTGGDYLMALPPERLDHARAALPAYLDHAVLVAENTVPLPALPAPMVLGRDVELSPPPVVGTRRPPHLGPNRLPAFPVPGRNQPAAMPIGPEVASLHASLPDSLSGIDIGWQRPTDPLGLLRPRRGKRRAPVVDAALEEQLGFLSEGPQTVRLAPLPFDERRLPSGITLRLQPDHKAPSVAITVRVGATTPTGSLLAPSAQGTVRYAATVRPDNLDVGINLAVGRLAVLLGESRLEPQAALRTQLNRRRRKQLEAQRFGKSWLALSDALYPADHPQGGRIVSPAQPDGSLWTHRLMLLGLQEERRPEQATVSVVGDFDPAVVQVHLRQALATMGPLGAGSRSAAPPERGPLRLTISDELPHERLLFGWAVPPMGSASDLPLQVAVQILAGRKESRVQRELVQRELAASARGIVDVGWQASTVALEITPAATVRAETLERRLERMVADLAERGPTVVELAYATAILRYRLGKRHERSTTRPSPDLARATLAGRIVQTVRPGFWQQSLEALDDVTDQSVRKAVKRYLAPERRVLIHSVPAGTDLDRHAKADRRP